MAPAYTGILFSAWSGVCVCGQQVQLLSSATDVKVHGHASQIGVCATDSMAEAAYLVRSCSAVQSTLMPRS